MILTVVDYLLERLERGQIYTWIGTLLLAINPSDVITIEDIYNLSRAHEYDSICDMTYKEVSPHIFAVAARAHYRIVQGFGKSSQVIVLNGETGTGKTFNAWRALEFLTRSPTPDVRERRDTVCGIVQRISDACRLISAFTTASTERNKVSSRHVQLVWLEYKMGSICGATISSYLLERNRVTKGCCNFQIFNQMMTAIATIKFADTELSKERRYFLVSDLDTVRVQELFNSFLETLNAMDMLGFTASQRKDIFLVLSLLVHMGDIQFVQEDDYCRIDIDDQRSRQALENTCRLACVEKSNIAELLTSTLINPRNTRRRHTVCRRNLNTSDACRYRLHSIIRYLYDLLFSWLINSINEILSARLYSERLGSKNVLLTFFKRDIFCCSIKKYMIFNMPIDTSRALGILDIFGFECFDSNGIEQLCVNYVNERLQQYFVEKYLVSCRNDLQKEGLIGYEESSEIVRLYEDRISILEKYLFATINDMCLSTVPSDSSTLIRQMYAKSCPATRQFLHVGNEHFVVRHYGGAVKYSVCDLLSKNIDKIPDEIIETFSLSGNKFLYSLINKSQSCRNGKAKKPTMLSKLRCNVDSLIQELNKCDMHYVRCIKPQRVNNEWDRDELRKQLANTGVLDALPLARCKYPIHFVYKDFFKRYNKKRTETRDLRVACKDILESFRLTMDDDSSVHYGKRLIFLRESMFLRLESARRRFRVECVRKIESFWIKHRNYRHYMEDNTTDDIRTIVNANTKNELIEEYQSKSEDVVPVVEKCERDINENIENINNNAHAVVQINKINRQNHEQSQFERSLLEYECIIPIKDIAHFESGNYVEMLARITKKSAYILHWLDGINKGADTKDIRPSILDQLREIREYDQSITDCSKEIQSRGRKPSDNNNNLRMRNGYEKKLDYNEKEDMNIIQCGTFTLFYKNRVLSRRRPARVPIKIHTRLRSLTNSHYLVHTELPQGLEDCL